MARPRSWGRWAVLLAACISAGAAITVLLAWSLVLWAPWEGTSTQAELVWPRRTPDGWPPKPESAFQNTNGLIRGRVANFYDRSSGPSGMWRGWQQQVFSAGWPMSAMEWEGVGTTQGGRILEFKWLAMWQAPAWLRPNPLDADRRKLPLRPYLPGFLVDTLFWGALCFALLLDPGAPRRYLRRRRGRCVSCGYDLRGLAPDAACPECGASR